VQEFAKPQLCAMGVPLHLIKDPMQDIESTATFLLRVRMKIDKWIRIAAEWRVEALPFIRDNPPKSIVLNHELNQYSLSRV
jgi:hypothetical protein